MHPIDEAQTKHLGNGKGLHDSTLQVHVRIVIVRYGGGVRITERWYLDHMGAMAFWRTVIGMANLTLTVLVVLRVFEIL